MTHFHSAKKEMAVKKSSTKPAAVVLPKPQGKASVLRIGSSTPQEQQQRHPLSVPSIPETATKTPSMSRTSSHNAPKKGKLDVREALSKRGDSLKPSLNLVVVGHVDAGKSTIMGHVLMLLGHVNERIIKKYEREAEQMKKSSFAFAWVLDETDEERSRGVTMDIAIRHFETEHRQFTLLDAPGHRDFIPNMISGAAQADVAMLVVDSGMGEFEAGFDLGGQTREHALLLRSLGVTQVIVAVNKLDVVQWSANRYFGIQAVLTAFLTQQAGFKESNITYVPCSGFSGENLLTRKGPLLTTWYDGPTLIQAIDSLQPGERQLDKPFRLAITDFFKGGLAGSGANVTVCGRVESGYIQVGDPVLVMPINEVAHVKVIEVNDEGTKWTAAGDNIMMSLTGIDILQMSPGSILCDVDAPVPITRHFKAQIVTFDLNVPLTMGVPIVLHAQGYNEPGYISSLECTLNKSTGQIIKKHPRALTKNMTAMIEIKMSRPVCLDLFRQSKSLGRFTLRSGSVTVAAGIVTEILSFEKSIVCEMTAE